MNMVFISCEMVRYLKRENIYMKEISVHFVQKNPV